MIIVRKSEERRHIAKKDQKTWMTFDSENKADPLHKGFGLLKILNEEVLSPGSGFILHTHKDMVIVTYLREGMIIYKGLLEDPALIEAKDFLQSDATPSTKQYAFNISETEDAHIFQSGFSASEDISNPSESKKLFTHAERQGILKLIASPDGKKASLNLRQDVYMYSTYIHNGNHMIHELGPGRSAWIHVVKGEILLNHHELKTGDGAGISEERSVSFTGKKPTEILLFDLGAEVAEELKADIESNLANASMS